MAQKPARSEVRQGVVLRHDEYTGRDGEIIKVDISEDDSRLSFPEYLKDPGYTYQWARHLVYGDPSYSELPAMKRRGWREVDVNQLNGYFKSIVPEGDQFVNVDGMFLMERPKHITQMFQERAFKKAKGELAKKVEFVHNGQVSLPEGIEPLTGQDRYGRRMGSYDQNGFPDLD